jgi:hypothetical protein
MDARTFTFPSLIAVVSLVSLACSTEPYRDGSPPVDTQTAGLSLCKKDQCGVPPAMPAELCSDGSLGGNTGRCIRTEGVCGWEIRECPTEPPPPPPPVDCTAAGACGPAPLSAERCGDGSTADFVCTAENGVCVWKKEECPPPPPEACGDVTCALDQTCCSGMPFTVPTCVTGSVCPISQRKFKKDIHYLSDADRARLNDELLAFRLATYRYKTEASAEREHLGFIIDDIAPSPAVVPSGERVDMYGYQTMAVAALQVQAREIAELRGELQALRRELGKKSSTRGRGDQRQ